MVRLVIQETFKILLIAKSLSFSIWRRFVWPFYSSEFFFFCANFTSEKMVIVRGCIWGALSIYEYVYVCMRQLIQHISFSSRINTVRMLMTPVYVLMTILCASKEHRWWADEDAIWQVSLCGRNSIKRCCFFFLRLKH